MTAPTYEEVQQGYDKITEDGPGAAITSDLATLIYTNQQLRYVVDRMICQAVASDLVPMPVSVKENAQLTALIMGAMSYGMHMGMHIGEARGREAHAK